MVDKHLSNVQLVTMPKSLIVCGSGSKYAHKRVLSVVMCSKGSNNLNESEIQGMWWLVFRFKCFMGTNNKLNYNTKCMIVPGMTMYSSCKNIHFPLLFELLFLCLTRWIVKSETHNTPSHYSKHEFPENATQSNKNFLQYMKSHSDNLVLPLTKNSCFLQKPDIFHETTR